MAPELKPLPSTLKYAFLDHHSANPVIISSQLDHDQEERLLAVLQARKEAIGWNLSDLKGIDPSLCTHRIFLEEDSRPSREEQRWLNPKVWDAVKDEILKWLNAHIIYPISDNPWVSPVHVVPKKEGITGGVRPPSPPRHDTTAPVEPTPMRVQPPRQAKTKDPEFHYTK